MTYTTYTESVTELRLAVQLGKKKLYVAISRPDPDNFRPKGRILSYTWAYNRAEAARKFRSPGQQPFRVVLC